MNGEAKLKLKKLWRKRLVLFFGVIFVSCLSVFQVRFFFVSYAQFQLSQLLNQYGQNLSSFYPDYSLLEDIYSVRYSKSWEYAKTLSELYVQTLIQARNLSQVRVQVLSDVKVNDSTLIMALSKREKLLLDYAQSLGRLLAISEASAMYDAENGFNSWANYENYQNAVAWAESEIRNISNDSAWVSAEINNLAEYRSWAEMEIWKFVNDKPFLDSRVTYLTDALSESLNVEIEESVIAIISNTSPARLQVVESEVENELLSLHKISSESHSETSEGLLEVDSAANFVHDSKMSGKIYEKNTKNPNVLDISKIIKEHGGFYYLGRSHELKNVYPLRIALLKSVDFCLPQAYEKPWRFAKVYFMYENFRLTQKFYSLSSFNHIYKISDLDRLNSQFFISLGFLLFLLLSFFVLLLALISLKGSINISFEYQFIIFFPEEFIAELGALTLRMKKSKVPAWKIRLRILLELLNLFWAFYVQIQIENLFLPSTNNKIDD